MFKNARWDLDAETNTFQELFEKSSKKKNKTINKQRGKIKKKIKNVENIVKNVQLVTKNLKSNDTVNLINTPIINDEKMTVSKRRRLRKLRAKLRNEKITNDINQNNAIKSKLKKTEIRYQEMAIKDDSHFTKKDENDRKSYKNQMKKLEKLSAELRAKLRNETISNDINQNNAIKSKLKKTENRYQQMAINDDSHLTKKDENDQKANKNKMKKLKKLSAKLKSKVNSISEQVTDNLKNKTEKVTTNGTNSSSEEAQVKRNKRKRKKRKHKTEDPLERSVTAGTEQSKGLTNPKIKKSDPYTTEKLIKEPSKPLKLKKKEKFIKKLKGALQSTREEKRSEKPAKTLRQKMMLKLQAARFRFINEQIYSTDSSEAQKLFQNDPEAFTAYHDGYRRQVKSWPLNPLDAIITSIKKMPKTHVIADFGCGDARLSKSVVQKVHSFDLVAADDTVVACDMSKVPLENNSVDVAVFCLSLMGTNLRDYLFEANRVLKVGGVLKIAEVESRFENAEDFIKGVQHYGFKNIWQDLSHNLFYFLDFKKERDVRHKNKLPTLSLLPCLYKKR